MHFNEKLLGLSHFQSFFFSNSLALVYILVLFSIYYNGIPKKQKTNEAGARGNQTKLGLKSRNEKGISSLN